MNNEDLEHWCQVIIAGINFLDATHFIAYRISAIKKAKDFDSFNIRLFLIVFIFAFFSQSKNKTLIALLYVYVLLFFLLHFFP